MAKKTYELEIAASDKKEQFIKWDFAGLANKEKGHKMITLTAKHIISRLTWHAKGDFFASMAHNIQATSQVIIHSLGKAQSQKPFSTTKGII